MGRTWNARELCRSASLPADQFRGWYYLAFGAAKTTCSLHGKCTRPASNLGTYSTKNCKERPYSCGRPSIVGSTGIPRTEACRTLL